MVFKKKYKILMVLAIFALIWTISLLMCFAGPIRYNTKYASNTTNTSIIFKRSGVFITKDKDNKELDRGTYSIEGEEMKLIAYWGGTEYCEIVDKETIKLAGISLRANQGWRVLYFIFLFFATIITVFIIAASVNNDELTPKPPTDKERIDALEKEIEELKKTQSK